MDVLATSGDLAVIAGEVLQSRLSAGDGVVTSLKGGRGAEAKIIYKYGYRYRYRYRHMFC